MIACSCVLSAELENCVVVEPDTRLAGACDPGGAASGSSGADSAGETVVSPAVGAAAGVATIAGAVKSTGGVSGTGVGQLPRVLEGVPGVSACCLIRRFVGVRERAVRVKPNLPGW